MKYSLDTYRMYRSESMFSHVIRIVVNMKENVDPDILRHSVNIAIRRYPYFAVRVTVDKDGGYVLQPNKEPVVVLPEGKKVPKTGSKQVNGHLLFVEYNGKTISFYISHSLCGGGGALPWVMTNIYQYVVEKFHVAPDAPAIRKPDSELLPGETDEPTLASLSDAEPTFEYKSKNPVLLSKDYLNGLLNPFKRDPNYRIYTFPQKEVVTAAKSNHVSIAGLFLIIVAKALDKVLPEENKVIGGEIAHNPMAKLGFPNTHCDVLSHVHIDYERDELKWEMEKLGSMTRKQMTLQTDISVSSDELRYLFSQYEEMDRIKGLKEKRKFVKKNDPSSGKQAKHGTYLFNYSGQMDWGEVADYVESYVLVVEGHMVMEMTSMNDKIFVSFMQLLNEEKYPRAIQEVLNELNIPYQAEGPFPKRLSKHDIPQK